MGARSVNGVWMRAMVDVLVQSGTARQSRDASNTEMLGALGNSPARSGEGSGERGSSQRLWCAKQEQARQQREGTGNRERGATRVWFRAAAAIGHSATMLHRRTRTYNESVRRRRVAIAIERQRGARDEPEGELTTRSCRASRPAGDSRTRHVRQRRGPRRAPDLRQTRRPRRPSSTRR